MDQCCDHLQPRPDTIPRLASEFQTATVEIPADRWLHFLRLTTLVGSGSYGFRHPDTDHQEHVIITCFLHLVRVVLYSRFTFSYALKRILEFGECEAKALAYVRLEHRVAVQP